jgi:hypothetical protein
MKQKPPIRSRLTSLGIGILLWWLGQPLSYGQAVSEYQVKAAYLYNFAKFVEWPPETFTSTTAPIRMCILNDRSFESQLNQVVKDKNVAGRPVAVIPVQNGEQSRDCQVLFLGSLQNLQALRVIEILHGTSVLTVEESNGFVKDGGMINFVLQGNQVHFQVNHKAATQAGLRLSSRLLSVAKLVIE